MKKQKFIVHALAVAIIFAGAAFTTQAMTVSNANSVKNATVQRLPKCPVGYESCPALNNQCVIMGTCSTTTN
ncbi:hypothetical protein HF690_09270 [Oleiagrimonas citrea]|uniref:Uncharacterized protein n=1 Tax=Oleiagrimonas citrea TaxID=1665687 RepID=A0A846ZNL3_9GAMM|nr:hypothetical protein [Oleiagrimonas citrea]NKZ39140.1 hypothetical protein [Oleiagrimonas citrea]